MILLFSAPQARFFKCFIVFCTDFLKEIKGTNREGMGYEIACAQLCGNSHYRMRGYVTIDTEAEYSAWLAEQAEYLEEEDDDDWEKLGELNFDKSGKSI